ncbi:MAG: lysine biosynthesis protein LysW [Candidatus Marinimicrobia bacterium]|nr:lysine biosynthesis protein LysW [Candidatus Neomarinimicrobiota bacterium]MCF7830014.1 lysine biosynthesis protein LysW [Candidatus Neomarinimicrobiota bacterium]MCF7881944.1 lysine biosynthesis protein LysW [Candidatus Neomarinimicrobiota bacterium]
MSSQTVSCPECGGDVNLDADVMAHEIIQCEECGVELEVVSTDPVEIDLAPEIEEDWGE